MTAGDAADRRAPKPAEPGGAAPADDAPLELTLRAIDAAEAMPLRRVPKPAREPSEAAQTLTAFDWLDTIVDEMLVAGDRAVERPAAITSRPQPFAITAAGALPAAVQIGDAAILGQVVLGYSPMIDRYGAVIATRLTVVPMVAGAALDAGALLRSVGEVWPEGGDAVSLNIASETLLADLLRASPTKNVMIEVPAFLAGDTRNTAALLELKARDNILLLKGRPLSPLPREVLPCFRWSIIDWSDDRRVGKVSAPNGAHRTIPHVQSGVRTRAQLADSLARGAIAVLGWPIDDEAEPQAREARPDLQVVVEMINRIDRREPIEIIERTLLRDPALAFELMRHVASPRFGLNVETASFHHAITMLGYHELRRWLALLLAGTGDDHYLKPTSYAALRRGLLMRELAPDGSDDEVRSELFMCGVFSLIGRVFAKPIAELLGALVVPERVRQALVDEAGPYRPMLDMAIAVESGPPHEIRAAADALFIGPREINRALLRSLAVAAQLE